MGCTSSQKPQTANQPQAQTEKITASGSGTTNNTIPNQA